MFYPQLKSEVDKRLKELYKGRYLLSYHKKLLIDNDNVTHSGLPVGDSRKISKRQVFKPYYLFISNSIPETRECAFQNGRLFEMIKTINISKKVPVPDYFITDLLD